MNRQIVIVDIDGPLTKYPQHFLEWVRNNFGISFKFLDDFKKEVSSKEYEKIKHKYRTSGIKRSLPLINYSKQTLVKLKKSGYDIWIMTSRPKWEPVKSDTIYWLKSNDLPRDRLIFVKNKLLFIKKNEKANLKIIIDDDSEIILDLAKKTVNIHLFCLKDRRRADDDFVYFVDSWKLIEKKLKENKLL